MKNNVRTLKTAMIISFVTLLFILIGMMIQFAQTQQFDATGCGILACNTAIYSSCLLTYQKNKENKNMQ